MISRPVRKPIKIGRLIYQGHAALASTCSREPVVYISSQLCFQSFHVSSLKPVRVGVFTPSKSANTTMQGFPSHQEASPAHDCPLPLCMACTREAKACISFQSRWVSQQAIKKLLGNKPLLNSSGRKTKVALNKNYLDFKGLCSLSVLTQWMVFISPRAQAEH